MNTIKQDELFENLSGFFKSKGVELKDGVYTQRIRQACDLLGEAINATQRTATNAKAQVDQTLDQLRQTIHEATARKPTGSAKAPPANGSAAEPASQAAPSAEPAAPAVAKKKKNARKVAKVTPPVAGRAAARSSGKRKKK